MIFRKLIQTYDADLATKVRDFAISHEMHVQQFNMVIGWKTHPEIAGGDNLAKKHEK